jgi:hypothetical protein
LRSSSYAEFVENRAYNLAQLAPLFMDDQPVALPDQARPTLSAIVSASGKQPSDVRVERLKRSRDANGNAVDLSAIVDRTMRNDQPHYFRCFENAAVSVPR